MIDSLPTAPEIDEVTRQKVRGLVGLGVRGRLVVVGSERVKIDAQKGGVFLAIVAVDASKHSLDKVVPTLRARNIDIIEWPSAAELGAFAGRESTTAIGIADQALAQGIRKVVFGTPSERPRPAFRSGRKG
ncbi:MAG: L7Ae/L30e/S12e/Gadd45 family ribosomal protein [Gemmatimonas sp.]